MVDSSAEEAYTSWLTALRDLAVDAALLLPEVRDPLAQALHRLQAERVTVVFGGHFKSGKSTAINAALGRAVLPVDDLPETGASCVLRSASIDFAQVRGATEVWPIPFTPEAIQEVVSLLSETGQRRAAMQQIRQVDLTLASSPIPAQAAWVDTPGINDTPEMDERAREAARTADVLVWVLGSRQLLSEAEMAFLAPLLEERGPAFLIFLVNAFLPEDSEAEWAAFQERQLPRHRSKIEDAARELGLPEGSTPEVLVVAGRALQGGGSGFGGAELREALAALGSGQSPRVRSARLQHASAALRRTAPQVQAKIEAERVRIAAAEQALKQKQQVSVEKQDAYRTNVERITGVFLSEWSTRVRSSAQVLAATTHSGRPLESRVYAEQLNSAIRAEHEAPVEGLLEQLGEAARQAGLPALRSTQLAELRRALEPPEAAIAAPAGEGGPGGVVGDLLHKVSDSPLGAKVGGWFGRRAPEPAVGPAAEIGSLILAAAEGAIERMAERAGRAVDYVVTHSFGTASAAQGSKPDEAHVQRLEALLTSAVQLADGAAGLSTNPQSAIRNPQSR